MNKANNKLYFLGLGNHLYLFNMVYLIYNSLLVTVSI